MLGQMLASPRTLLARTVRHMLQVWPLTWLVWLGAGADTCLLHRRIRRPAANSPHVQAWERASPGRRGLGQHVAPNIVATSNTLSHVSQGSVALAPLREPGGHLIAAFRGAAGGRARQGRHSLVPRGVGPPQTARLACGAIIQSITHARLPHTRPHCRGFCCWPLCMTGGPPQRPHTPDNKSEGFVTAFYQHSQHSWPGSSPEIAFAASPEPAAARDREQ